MYTLLLYIHTAINIYPANFFLSIFLCQRSTFNSEKKNLQTSHSFFKLWVSQKYVQNSIELEKTKVWKFLNFAGVPPNNEF